MKKKKQCLSFEDFSQGNCFSLYGSFKQKQKIRDEISSSLGKPIFYNKAIDYKLPRPKQSFLQYKSRAGLDTHYKSLMKEGSTPTNKKVFFRKRKYTEGYSLQRQCADFSNYRNKTQIMQHLQTQEDFMKIIKHISSCAQSKTLKQENQKVARSFMQITGKKLTENSLSEISVSSLSMLKTLKQRRSKAKKQNLDRLFSINNRNSKNHKQSNDRRKLHSKQDQQLCGWD